MKKLSSLLIMSLFVITAFYPVCAFICACLGYTFEITAIHGFSIIIAVLFMITVVQDIIFKNPHAGKGIKIPFFLLGPFSVINCALCIIKSPHAMLIISISFIVSISCYIFLVIRHFKTVSLQVTAVLLCVIMIIPLGFFCSISLFLKDFVHDIVVESIASPDRKYYVNVIESDQGALGGNTFVEVYKVGVHTRFFKIEKFSHQLYSGDWLDFQKMQIYWKDNHCIVINNTEYEID